MSFTTVTALGAIAGFTIFLGLPVARLRALPVRAQGFLNALALGVLLFLLWDILGSANEPIHEAMAGAGKEGPGRFLALAGLFVAGLAVGLLALTGVTRILARRLGRPGAIEGPGAAVSASGPALAHARALAMMIATGLGLHNFSEGLAIGESAAAGAIAFTGVLVIGFALHNITEGFGVAAPMAGRDQPPSWGFLAAAGLIAGAPTMLGTMVGYLVHSDYAFVLFLALAAGALIHVIMEMVGVSRRLNAPFMLATGLLVGFLGAWATDLLLKAAGS